MTFPSPFILPPILESAPSDLITAYHQTTSSFNDGASVSINIGTASSDRFVLVCLLGVSFRIGSSTAVTVNPSVTCNSNAMTRLVFRQNQNSSPPFSAWSYFSAWFGLTVASGTTATIVMTSGTDANPSVANAGIYSLKNLTSTTPVATNQDNTSPLSMNLNVSDGGVCLAGGLFTSSSTSITPTGVVLDYSDYIHGGTSVVGAFGYQDNLTAATPRSISLMGSAAGYDVGTAISML